MTGGKKQRSAQPAASGRRQQVRFRTVRLRPGCTVKRSCVPLCSPEPHCVAPLLLSSRRPLQRHSRRSAHIGAHHVVLYRHQAFARVSPRTPPNNGEGRAQGRDSGSWAAVGGPHQCSAGPQRGGSFWALSALRRRKDFLAAFSRPWPSFFVPVQRRRASWASAVVR